MSAAMILFVILIVLAIYVTLNWLIHLPKVANYGQKYVVITGCDGGIGKLLTLRLDVLGFNVFAGCHNTQGKDGLAEVCSPRVTPALLDVTSEDSVDSFLKLVKGKLPANKGIWALVNNASISGNSAHNELLTKEDFLKVLDVNVIGLADMTRTFLPLIRKSRGRIVNMSSVHGRLGFLSTPYTASKFGVEAFSDILRQEVYRQGIKMSLIEPFFMKTVGAETATEMQRQTGEPVGKSDTATIRGSSAESTTCLKPRFFYFHENGYSATEDVLDAYTHAITARVSRVRYVIGWNAKMVTRTLCHLPDFITDLVIQAARRSSA